MGKRAANSKQPAIDVQSREMTADLPFQKACVDHTLLDILVVVARANGKSYTARPQITVLVDDATGYWITFGLSLDTPSRQSIALLFRRCVRTFAKLPETIHSDRGAEFRSRYYQELLAHLGCSANWSPPAHARFNSQAERLLKDITHSWIHKRVGNLSKTENYRSFSSGYRPKDTAELTLLELFNEIESYRDLYNNATSPQEFESRESLFKCGLRNWPFSGIDITYDRQFEIASAVETKFSDYAIHDQGYISKNGFHYQHPDLKEFKLTKKRLMVREDPENPYVIHCLGPDGWITASTLKAQNFDLKPPYERYAEAVGFNEGGRIRSEMLQDKNEQIVRLKDEHLIKQQESKYLANNEPIETDPQVQHLKQNPDRFMHVREASIGNYSTQTVNAAEVVPEDEE